MKIGISKRGAFQIFRFEKPLIAASRHFMDVYFRTYSESVNSYSVSTIQQMIRESIELYTNFKDKHRYPYVMFDVRRFHTFSETTIKVFKESGYKVIVDMSLKYLL